MAGLKYRVATGEVAITSTAKTVVTISAPANQRVKIRGISIWGKGTSNTDSPVKVEYIRANSITGGTAGTVTTTKSDGDIGETIQSTVAGNYTAEPTYTSGVTEEVKEVHPQSGWEIWPPSEDDIVLKGGTVFALRLTSVQNETVAVVLYCEE